VIDDFMEAFDINIIEGFSAADVEFAKLMFHRRHVYEHKGGEADEKYIAESGDSSVRPKQALKETQESAHRIASLVLRMATNLQRGFHELLPPFKPPIRRFERLKKPKGGASH
jgi:molybdopterin-guanine dinucleotide biosynthesis protein